MSVFSLSASINTGRVLDRISDRKKETQFWLDNEVVKDSEPYVPYDDGGLTKSGIIGSVMGSGDIQYNAPYAKAQYYGLEKKSKDVHPQASTQWFEKAKAIKKSKWTAGVNKLMGGG